MSPVKNYQASEGLESRMFEEKLRPLDLLSLEKRHFGENLLLSTVTCWEGGEKIDPDSSMRCPVEGREAAGPMLQHGEF